MSPSDGGNPTGSDRIIAEFRVAHPDFPLMQTLASVPDLEIRSMFQPGTSTETPEKYFVVESEDFERLEAAVRADATVEELEVVTHGQDQRTYRIRFTADTFLLSPTFADLPVQVDAIDKAGDRWLFRVVAEDRAAMMTALERAQEACPTYTLDRLFAPEGRSDGPPIDLTPTQLETLRLAFEEGYFEVPRRTSLAALGEALGVSDSAVSNRIRAGTASLIAQTVCRDRSERG